MNGAAGPAAGCSGCEIEAIAAVASVSVGYKIRSANGWGDWKYDGDAAGCFGCKIEAMQLVNACCNIVSWAALEIPDKRLVV